ncbi:hypothetical protein MMC25_001102 [Agyrium rufum]|nr:hypothetical protein [Agyrium rufum]
MTTNSSSPSPGGAWQRSKHTNQNDENHESTPLLVAEAEDRHYDDTREGSYHSRTADDRPHNGDEFPAKSNGPRRWPSLVALIILTLTLLAILGVGFAAPAAVEEYAKEALAFKPTDLSILNFTTEGVEARIQGDFVLDASRVQKKPVRDLGRFGTWIAKKVESKESTAEVYLPEYNSILLGKAVIPPVVVDIRNGHVTHIDLPVRLTPGKLKDIRYLASQWLEGKLGDLRIVGNAEVPLRSGIFNLGTQKLSQTLLFKSKDIPAIPQYNISRLNFHEVRLPQVGKAMAADASVEVKNDYPLSFNVPPLGFDILIPNCAPDQPYILLANATTKSIDIFANEDVRVDVEGTVRQLPEVLTTVCPDSASSPLDQILGRYISGVESTIYVRGTSHPLPDTPPWVSDLIGSIVVPLPFRGHSFDGLIREFSLDKVHLGLPDPFAEPNTPESQPRISAVVTATASLPQEMNFDIDISKVRADAEVYYKGRKLGDLDLRKWQKANATRIESSGDDRPGLNVQSVVKDAPLEVTDDEVFTEVVQALLFGGKSIILDVKAKVDIETETILGKFIVRDIPAEGKVPIKPLSHPGVAGFSPKVGSLKILETTRETLSFEALVNITNPTNYSANVPYVNIHLMSNGSYLGYAISENVKVVPGANDNILMHATWDPVKPSHIGQLDAGRELLSQYISGYNTSLTLRTHNGTIPTLPRLGKALSVFKIDIPTPHLETPKNPNHPDDDEDDRDEKAPRFLDDATFHLFTSTATFTLLSPLPHSTITITDIDATAFYNHTEPVGQILYDLPFAVPPGASRSPKLPVDWSPNSVGYEAIKQALGGSLKLDAVAEVGISIGNWRQNVWFRGGGIGAKVRI